MTLNDLEQHTKPLFCVFSPNAIGQVRQSASADRSRLCTLTGQVWPFPPVFPAIDCLPHLTGFGQGISHAVREGQRRLFLRTDCRPSRLTYFCGTADRNRTEIYRICSAGLWRVEVAQALCHSAASAFRSRFDGLMKVRASTSHVTWRNVTALWFPTITDPERLSLFHHNRIAANQLMKKNYKLN